MIRKLRLTTGLVAVVAVALVPQLSWAQSSITTGSLYGTASDPDGAALPGVTIQATNTETGFSRSAVTDASGFYRIDLLPSATYDVRGALTGFNTEVQRGIPVTLGSTVRIDFAMQLSAVEEEIVVTAESPVVETSKPSIIASVSEDAIANLPLEGRDFTNFIVLTPGTAAGTVDEIDQGRNGINIGARAVQNSFNIDGTGSQSTFFGEERGGTRPPFTFSQAAIKEFQVAKSSYNLQFSASGGVINAITKSGTNDFHGEVFGYYTDDSLTEEDALGRKADSEQLQYGFALGGPFVRDTLHFFVSADTQDYQTPHFTQFVYFPEGREDDFTARTGIDYYEETSAYPSTNDALVLMLKLDWQLGINHLLTFRHNNSNQEGENLALPYENVGQSNNGFEENSFSSTVLSLNSLLSDNSFNEAFVQYAFEERPRTPNTTDLPEGGIRSYRGSWGQLNYLPNYLDEETWQIVDNFTHYFGDHTLKAGINLNLIAFDNYYPRYMTGQYLWADWDDFLDDTTPYSYQQAWSDYDFQYLYDSNFYAFYLQDEWRANPNLTVTYGVRYDLQEVDQPTVSNPLWPDTSQVPKDTDNWSLRAGFAWDIRGDGTSVLRGGLGRFYDFIPNLIYGNSINNNGVRVTTIYSACRYGDPCPEWPDEWAELPDLEGSSPSIHVMDPDFENSETDRISIGYERQVGRDFSVGVDVMYHETSKNHRGWNRNLAPNDGTTPDGRPTYDRYAVQPELGNIYQFTSDGSADYTAVMLTAHKRFSNNWALDASYTWSEANDNNYNERDTSDGYPEDQFNIDWDWGPSNYDTTHKFVVSAAWMLPLNFMVSAIGTYRTGFPYTAYGYPDHNTDGSYNDRALIEVSEGVYYHYPRNTERQPDRKNLDIRLSWTARLGGRFELELIGEVFNAFNNDNWITTETELVGWGDAINPDFGSPTIPGKPRRYQLGAKFRF